MGVRVYHRVGKHTAIGVPWWLALPFWLLYFTVWLVIAFVWLVVVLISALVLLGRLAIERGGGTAGTR